MTTIFINRLQELLIGDVQDWRGNIHVYNPLQGEASKHVGGLNVYSDWILIQREVYDLLPQTR